MFVLGLGGCQTLKPPEETILLCDPPNFSTNRAFQRLLRAEPGSPDYEKARIDYLLERLSRSRHQFLRNGEVFSNRRAVGHLKWKYWRYRREVKTAEDFVDRIAYGSRMSGQPYVVKVKPGEVYLLKRLFYNELKLLGEEIDRRKKEEESLKETSPPGAGAPEVKKEESAVDNTLKQVAPL